VLIEIAAQHRSRPPDLAGTVEIETEYGRLRLQADDAFITPYLVRDKVWEAGETANLAEYLQPGMTFVDIGAHVGYFSVLAARIVGPDGRVYAFEPAPRNYELLLANVWLNGLRNTVCFPWAIADAMAIVDLHLSPTNTGDNRIDAGEAGWEAIPVRAAALDAIGAIVETVHVVKIDVQGAEDRAIRGMEGLLAASPSVKVSAEFWPYGIRRSGGDPRGVLDYYRGLGFTVRVQNADVRGVKTLTDEEIFDLCREKDGQAFVTLLLERR
jgi:FkbM family methyltransferase